MEVKPMTNSDTCRSGMERSGTFSAFPYIGSKTYLAGWVVDNLQAHENFVVPFGGAAGVMLNKPRSGCEIYNDRDEYLVEFFEACRDHPEELKERVRNIPFSRSVYEEWSVQFRSGEDWPDGVVESAARWVFLRYASFSGRYGQRAGFATDTPRRGPQKSTIWKQMPERVDEVRERFRGVAIECLDYSDILGRYDDKDVETLYYCDPPYTEAKDDYYRGPRFDHQAFVQHLADVDGDWVVSYREPPAGLEDIASAVVERSYNRSAGEQNEDTTERLYLSYEPNQVPMFVQGSMAQATLVPATDGGNRRDVDTGTDRNGGGE
jgi:DNA adenine methylase